MAEAEDGAGDVDGIRALDDGLLDRMVDEAAGSPRLRSHHNLHDSLDDPVQRLFVAVRRGSYFRPHRHADKGELAWVVRGRFSVLVFSGAGVVTSRVEAGPGCGSGGFEVAPGAWHTYVALEDGSVFLEVKQGPYVPGAAAEFAEWAPAEGADGVPAFVGALERAVVGDRPLETAGLRA